MLSGLMKKKFSCLLVSPLADDRVLVEEGLRRRMPQLQTTQVVDASGWQQALAAGDFDLVIIGEQLPWADNATLIQTLKSRWPECPVIMLANPERERAAWKAMLSGLDDYLLRSPEDLPRLGSVVQAAHYRARYSLARHQVEEALKTSEAGYREIIDTIDKVIFIHDPETGSILDANQEACDRLGYTREEFKNLNLGALSLGEPLFTQLGVQKRIKDTIQEGPQSFEWLIRDKSGKPFWAEITLRPVFIGGQERVLSFAHDISRFKRIQEALSEAEQRYETFLDSAADAIFIHDTTGRLLQVNDAACKLLGYNREELQQMTLKDIDAPSHATIQKRIRESHHQRHAFLESALKHREGSLVPVELGSCLMEYSGIPVTLSIARDITGRKDAEEKLRQSEIMYRSIFATTGTATCIDDENTILRLVNAKFAELTGYDREELEGKKSWTEFIVPEDLERLKEYHRLRRTDSQAAPASYSFRWKDRHGQVKDILATIALIPGTKNSVASLLDITARQQAEKALRESEVRHRLLVETMNDGLGMQDDDGRITFVNQRLCEILGYSKEELIGRPIADCLDAANQKILKKQRQLRQQGGCLTYELDWIRKDGKTVSTSISPVPLFDAAGKYKGSFAVVADITARQQAEKALRESEEKYRAIFENSGTAMAIVNEDNTISLVNAEFEKISGYSREEVEGKKKWMEFAAMADQAMMAEYHRQRRLEPHLAPRNYEARFIDRQGGVKDMLVTAGMIPGTNKSVGSLLDITAHKKAEQERDYERKKFQILTENSPFALVMIDKDGAFKYVSPKFSELFGYALEDVPDGKTWFRKAYPDPVYRQEVISAWVKDLESSKPGEKRARTYTVTCKDGSAKIISFILVQLDSGEHLMTCADITDRHRAEEAVKQSEQRFRLLMENSMVHLGVIDAQGIVLYEGPTLESHLGYDSGEMLGKNSSEFLHPEDQALSQEVMRKLLESPGKVFSAEVRYLHKDGSWRWLEVKAKNLLDEPVIRGIVVNSQDITPRKEAREALRQSEERYRAIVEDQTELVTRFLPDGTFTFGNETLCRFIGKSQDELVGINFYPFLPNEEKGVVRKNLAALGRDNPISTHEYRVFMPDGQVIWHQWTTRAIFDNLGRIIEFQAVGRDITQRKRAEEALRESEKLHARILDTMPDIVYELSLNGNLIYANQTTSDILGYAPEELLRLNLKDLLDADGLEHANRVVQEMVASRRPSRTESYHLRTAQGHFIPIEAHAILVERSNQPPSIIGVARDITERQWAEQALRQAEAEKSLILNNMSEMVTYRDREHRILLANPAAADCHGLTPEEMVGRFCYEIFHQRHTPCPDCQVIKVIDTGQAIEQEIVKPDGRILSSRSSPVKDENCRIVGYVVVATDITARKKTEEALRRAEEEKSIILKNMSEKVLYFDRDFRIIWANQVMADFLGLAPEEMVGHLCYEITRQRSHPCPDCPVIKAMEAGRPIETEILNPKGLIISYKVSPVKDENGEVQGIVAVVSDITARKRAEEAIKASEEKMRLVIESSPVGIRITQQGRHIYANPALVKMFDYEDPGELVGRPVDLLFAPDARGIYREVQEAGLAGQPAPLSYEARGLKKDGARLDVQVWQTEIDYQGEPARLDFILDLSEAKSLRSQLLQAQKMDAIGTLAGGIAHDFNNILFPILVNAEMVLEGLVPHSPLRQRLERVIKACQRAIDLVKQILAFSRKEERELAPVRLTKIIEDSLKLLRASLPATIEMRKNLDCAADVVLADATQIQQVLVNLYTNAAHALKDREGVIEISLTDVEAGTSQTTLRADLSPGPYVQMTVRDNGQGMDPATLPRIFDPYFTTKKPGEGTGLGLAMAHGIIKRHRGAITVDSEPGKGSSFHVFLPRVEAEALTETKESLPLPQGRERILLVDDEAEIIRVVRQMLERLGYRVVALTSSLEALDTFRARAEEFDLVITDQTMPHLTGADLAREMLKLRPDLPIILCTGYSDLVSSEKAKDLGIREFIIKPIATRVMAETIRRALTAKDN